MEKGGHDYLTTTPEREEVRSGVVSITHDFKPKEAVVAYVQDKNKELVVHVMSLGPYGPRFESLKKKKFEEPEVGYYGREEHMTPLMRSIISVETSKRRLDRKYRRKKSRREAAPPAEK